jgi:transcriptional regulator with XRE-family HTH domain
MELADFRKRQNWTLEDVAGFIGVSNASVVHKHETGRIMPRPRIIEAYRKLSGGLVTADDFARTVSRFRQREQLQQAA